MIKTKDEVISYLKNRIEGDIWKSVENAKQKNRVKGTAFERFFIIDVICDHCDEIKKVLYEERDNVGLSTDEIDSLISEISLKLRMNFAE